MRCLAQLLPLFTVWHQWPRADAGSLSALPMYVSTLAEAPHKKGHYQRPGRRPSGIVAAPGGPEERQEDASGVVALPVAPPAAGAQLRDGACEGPAPGMQPLKPSLHTPEQMTSARHATPQTSSNSLEHSCVLIRLRTPCRYAVACTCTLIRQCLVRSQAQMVKELYAGTLTRTSSESVCLLKDHMHFSGGLQSHCKGRGRQAGAYRRARSRNSPHPTQQMLQFARRQSCCIVTHQCQESAFTHSSLRSWFTSIHG